MQTEPTLITADNCPSRIIFDDTSSSFADVMCVAPAALAKEKKLAYIWRPLAGLRQGAQALAFQHIYSPILEKLRHSCPDTFERMEYSIRLMDGFNYAALPLSYPAISSIAAEYRVDNLLMAEKRFTLSLRASESNILSGQLEQATAKLFENSQLTGYPHLDGFADQIVPDDDFDEAYRKMLLRALVVDQGKGTVFYNTTLAKLSTKLPFVASSYVAPELMKGRQFYTTQEGDVLIFERGYRPFSRGLIHNVPPAEDTDPRVLDPAKARLLRVYDFAYDLS